MQPRSAVARLVLVAAIVAGVSYLISWRLPLPEAASIAWKGAGVGLLACYAALLARRLDGWLLVAVMALGALGDVLLEAAGLTVGAVAFLAGHLVAIQLYLRNARKTLGLAERLVALALPVAIIAAAWLLPTDRGQASGIAFYAAGLGLMAGAAWISAFPRGLVALGAAMFALSDLLIFARMGPLAGQPWVDFAVWALYFAGQLRICMGATRSPVQAR